MSLCCFKLWAKLSAITEISVAGGCTCIARRILCARVRRHTISGGICILAGDLDEQTYNDRMLSAEARSRFTVVLVGARNPQNIGAAARALQDFGFTDLRVVNEFAPPFEAAQLESKSAVGAAEVMRNARLYATLEEAIADCTLVAGTTAIGGRKLDRAIVALADAAPTLLQALSAEPSSAAHSGDGEAPSQALVPRVALLFGSEKTGLTREQLSFCSLLLTIPMFAPEGRHLSMNLGQSVAVCLYELSRGGFEGSRDLPRHQPANASVDDRERLLELVLAVMHSSDYARRFPANARVNVVRQLVNQLGDTRDEAMTWMGLFRVVHRALSPHED